MSSKDNLGDKLKDLENIETSKKAIKGIPLMARLDGRGFSKFTKGLNRPYDVRMSQLMIDTTKYLVENTQACIGYTQSDEITLVWYNDYESPSEYMFDGKYQKLVSTLAAMATAYFNSNLCLILPEKRKELPTFDCRVWQVPTLRTVYLNFLWREQDATKNSISMAAHEYFSQAELYKKNSSEKLKMLEDKGIIWWVYPIFFKRGTYVQRKQFELEFDQATLDKIPKDRHPVGKILRSKVVELNLPVLSTIANPEDVLIYGKEFICKNL